MTLHPEGTRSLSSPATREALLVCARLPLALHSHACFEYHHIISDLQHPGVFTDISSKASALLCTLRSIRVFSSMCGFRCSTRGDNGHLKPPQATFGGVGLPTLCPPHGLRSQSGVTRQGRTHISSFPLPLVALCALPRPVHGTSTAARAYEGHAR